MSPFCASDINHPTVIVLPDKPIWVPDENTLTFSHLKQLLDIVTYVYQKSCLEIGSRCTKLLGMAVPREHGELAYCMSASGLKCFMKANDCGCRFIYFGKLFFKGLSGMTLQEIKG